MRIAIAGGTGFVGRALTNALVTEGHEVLILTRNKKNEDTHHVQYVQWLEEGDHQVSETLSRIDGIVNLAGESINDGRWTEERKKSILESRVHATQHVINLIQRLETKPKVLVNASAIGYYGTSTDEAFTESTVNAGNDFLASVCVRWEQEARRASDLGVRVVCSRFGLILGTQGGALPKMLIPYRMFVGGPLGSGDQWYSWVHIDDVVGLIIHSLKNDAVEGPLNVTAPNPTKMNEFGKAIAKEIKRPHWFPTPGFLLRWILGEMSILVLEGQKVLPSKALETNYQFRYPTIREALQNLLKL